jgi:hypothetical protein
MSLHWGRALRQRLAPFIPERIKRPLRPRLFGYRPSGVVLPIAFSSNDRERCSVIDQCVTLRYRDEDAADFQYHLADNGESIEEIASFMALAGSARTLFDVGAWKGLFSLIFCRLHDDARAVAYEPLSSGIDAMTALAALNGCASRIMPRRAASACRRVARRRGWRPEGSSPLTPMCRAAMRSTICRSCRSMTKCGR